MERLQSDTLAEAYYDRNQAVLALAKLAKENGLNVGLKIDPEDPEWKILFIDLPTGQVSWHLPKDEIVILLPEYKKQWDKHTLEKKRNRVKAFINLK